MKPSMKLLLLLIAGVFFFGTVSARVADDDAEKKSKSLRFMQYNILKGMKLDKEQNFDNFVAWVREQNPDILALCECNYFTTESLAALAARYGHPYVVLCKEKGYPVALTSKYPIDLRRRMLEDAPLCHGALHLKVKDLNIVVLHLYPLGRYPREGGKPNSGNEYRDNEMNYILDNTFRSLPREKKWIVCGDFNSYSVVDADHMSPSTYFGTHDIIRNEGLCDALHEMDATFHHTVPTDGFHPREEDKRRLDYIYVTPSLMKKVTDVRVIYDDFTKNKSDHYPVVMDFKR